MSSPGASDGQEKSFDPTPGRIEKARRDGDIALSREANAAAAYAGLYLVIVAGAGAISVSLAQALAHFFEAPEHYSGLLGDAPGAPAAAIAGLLLPAAAVLLGAPALAVLAALFAQQGFAFAPSKLAPKWSRLSLVDNAKQKFGPQGLSEFSFSAAKLLAILALFAVLFIGRFATLPGSALAPAASIVGALHEEAVLFIGAILMFSVVVGAVDLLRVRFAHKKKLMMSLDEMRRENKETEGDPQFKQTRRDRARAIAANRMLLDVPKASVVIVNPTHYAVALKWDGPNSGAPQCVAKGVDEMAAKIREIAATSGVPIRRDPPTARAIHGAVEIGEEIAREHYAAVAAAIHFADAIRKKERA